MSDNEVVDLTRDDGLGQTTGFKRRNEHMNVHSKQVTGNDSTNDDIIEEMVIVQPVPPKKKPSAKKRRIDLQLQEYVSNLSELDRSQVIQAHSEITNEKQSLMDERMKILKQANTTTAMNQVLNRLETCISFLMDWSEGLRRGDIAPRDAASKAQEATRVASGCRSIIQSISRQESLNRLHADTTKSTERDILQDPAYIEARSSSMVTSNSVTTNTWYRPGLTPEASNQELIRQAFLHPERLLPDGTPLSLQSVNSESGTPSNVNGAAYYDDLRARNYYHNNGMNGQYDESRGVNNPDIHSEGIAKYEHLLDLALNEAEPLDMPPHLKCNQLEHQRQGLGWLVRAERGKNRGSILADDMGLGKTIQTIALIYANPPEANEPHLTLIVCPVALVATWNDELIERVEERFHKRIYIHHRGMSKSEYLTDPKGIDETCDIVICTYAAISMEFKFHHENLMDPDNPKFLSNKKRSPLFNIKWHRIVLDEAHYIKNQRAKISIAVSHLNSKYRLALTGTPMQNNLGELYPLIRFLHIDPYQERSEFQRLVPPKGSSNVVTSSSTKAFSAFIGAVMLRRKKDTLINGKKIIDSLPPKHVKDIVVIMPEDEMSEYKDLENKTQKEVQLVSDLNGEMAYSNMLVLLLRLRQKACHNKLMLATRKSTATKSWGDNRSTRQLMKMSASCFVQLGNTVPSPDSENNLCYSCEGPMGDISHMYVLPKCMHFICSECVSSLQNELLEGPAQCPGCSQSNSTIGNVEMLVVLRDQYSNPAFNGNFNIPLAVKVLQNVQRPRLQEEAARDRARTRELKSLMDSFDSNLFFDGDDGFNEDDIPLETSDDSLQNIDDSEQKKDDDPLREKLDIHKVARLFKVDGVFNNGWCSSAKVDACLDVLRKIWSESPADKVIIFTFFTTMIDLLTIPLDAARIDYVPYTGKMGIEERNDVLERFKNGRSKLLLASLKAGNVGLTLTQANHVIIMEPFWNPYVEEQAQDRVYRIGQSREVTVYRLRVKDTVEDRIIQLQDDKRNIIEGALDHGTTLRPKNLSRGDILFALGISS